MNEIEIFESALFSHPFFTRFSAYSLLKKEIFNPEDSARIYFQCSFENRAIDRSINFNFYPSHRKGLKALIEIYIAHQLDSANTSHSFSLDAFLAYQKTKKKIKHTDAEKFRFHFEPDQLPHSLLNQLNQIFEMVEAYLTDCLNGSRWPAIEYDL